MSLLPPDADPPDDVDASYQRLSSTDRGRPGDAVRRHILQHAAQVAAGRSRWRRWPRRSRDAVIATLAAAAFAGLIVVPRFLQEPRLEPPTAVQLATNAQETAMRAADAPVAAPAAAGRAARTAASSGIAAEQATARAAPQLKNSGDVNARDAAGHTPLMNAILQGDAAAVDALLARGADAARADADGITPLQAAVARGDPAIVSSLQRALRR